MFFSHFSSVKNTDMYLCSYEDVLLVSVQVKPMKKYLKISVRKNLAIEENVLTFTYTLLKKKMYFRISYLM